MNIKIVLIAHAPFAQALRACAMHVYPECAEDVIACDVPPEEDPERTHLNLLSATQSLGDSPCLVLTDIFGATPANIAKRWVQDRAHRLIAGVNLPMLFRVLCYRHEPIDNVVQRALAGGAQGVMQVVVAAPQNQNKQVHDSKYHHHQQ
jgi:PTS system ascorbate-specific IIA component